jgi:rare lipoprotein A
MSRGAGRVEIVMSAVDRVLHSHPGGDANRHAVRLVGAVLMAASLAACAQSPPVTGRSASLAASPATPRAASGVPRVAVATPHQPVAVDRRAAATSDPSLGVASYYAHGARTASGEKFDANELTAAHPTLPFGTRLRVTNVANGQSVTVRVNDRGPFVAGRVVDVSYGAADALGMVGRGVARVKLDVVQ